MSDDKQKQIDQLSEANRNLTQQCQQHTANAEVLSAHLEAHKSMLNDSLSSTLQLKAHTLMLEKKVKELTDRFDSESTPANLKDHLQKAK